MDNNNMNNTLTNVVPNNTTPVQPTVQATPVAPTQPVAPTPVVPTTPVTDVPVSQVNGVQTPSSDPNKKNNMVLYIVFGIVLVVVIACIVYFLLSEINKKDDNETKEPETNQNENQNHENNEEPNNNEENEENENPPIQSTATDLSLWNGRYTNGTIDIVIYQSAYDLVSVNISNNSNSSVSFDTEVESDMLISYEDDFFEDADSVTIEKTAAGIKITASSTDTESLLNTISGEYTKNAFTSYGWGGNYVNDNINVIINEVDQDYITCIINKGYSTSSFDFDTINETELKYEDSFDGKTVTVAKNDNGIQITASATDTENLLNEVSGTYTKK